jgi:hypothetical protein
MTDIDALLAEARRRSENVGYLYGRKETADDYVKTTYALLYEDAPQGTVSERDAWVKRQDDYRNAIDRKRDAYAAYKTADTYLKLLFAEVEVWRSKQANNRFLDKVHQ